MANVIPTGAEFPWRARTNCTVSDVTTYTVTATASAAGDWDTDNDFNRIPVTPGVSYTASANGTLTAGSNRTGRLAVEWLTATPTLISFHNLDKTLVSGSAVSFSQTLTAPADAAHARIILRGLSAVDSTEKIAWSSISFDDGGATAPTPTIESHSVSGIDSTKATITVDTTNATSVKVEYSTDSTFASGVVATSAKTPDANGVTTHSLTGLAASTTYYYRVVADTTTLTPAGNSFATTAAETLTSRSVINITATSVDVVVGTTNASQVWLSYSTAADFSGAITTPPVAPVSDSSTHSLTSLTPQTTYYYKVIADDVTLATDGTFTTPSTSDIVYLYFMDDSAWKAAGLDFFDTADPTPPPTPAGKSLRIDTGGPGGVFGENTWSADAYVDGNTYGVTEDQKTNLNSTLGEVAPLYYTYRYGNAGKLNITVPTDFSRALVRIHQLDPTFSAAGQRKYAWHIPAGRLTEDIDLAGSGHGPGGQPLVTSLVVERQGTTVSITGNASIDNPIVAAIEVLDGSSLPLSSVIPEPAPPPPPPSTLAYSLNADLSNPAKLDGVILPTQSVRVLLDGTGIAEVSFWIDKADTTGPADYTDNVAPFVANNGDPITFSAGEHTVRAVVTTSAGATENKLATFTSPSPASAPPPTTGIITDGSTGRQAGPSDRVARMTGVNTHFTYSSYVNAGRDGIMNRIVECGLRHIRDDPNNTNIPYVRRLGEQGVKWWVMYHQNNTVNVTNQVNGFKNNILSVGQYVDGLLGYNEPDLSGAHSATTIRDQQGFMYNAYRSDSRFNNWPITTWAATFPLNGKNTGTGNVSSIADGGDFHPYPAGARPETNEGHNTLAELGAMKDRLASKPHSFPAAAWDYVDEWKSGKSFYTLSETGWHNNTSQLFDHRGIPEDVAGLYGWALCLWYDLHGIGRIHFYEMINQPGIPSSSIQGSFGLVRADLSPKPLFNTLKNGLSLYTDRGQAFTPGTLDYTVTGRTTRIFDTLHQKRDGTFLIGIWNGVTTWNDDNRTRNSVADVPIDIKFNKRNVSVRLHTPDASNVPTGWVSVPMGTNYRVPVTPGARVLEVRAQA